MDVNINKCSVDTFGDVVSIIDKEFILNKARSVSFLQRYPHLFQEKNWNNIYVACSNGRALATATVRPFALTSNKKVWKGVMIGLVCTSPEARGRGLGTLIMNSILQEHKATDTDFLVLWTGINDFYGKMGFVTEDYGVFGGINLESSFSNEYVAPFTCSDVNMESIKAIRDKYSSLVVSRSNADYSVLPPSVDSVEYYICDRPESEGYVIVGKKGEVGYIYELIGNKDSFQELLSSTRRNVKALFINDTPTSASCLWLTEKHYVKWQRQSQTMWCKLSKEFKSTNEKLYVPYFDRI